MDVYVPACGVALGWQSEKSVDSVKVYVTVCILGHIMCVCYRVYSTSHFQTKHMACQH